MTITRRQWLAGAGAALLSPAAAAPDAAWQRLEAERHRLGARAAGLFRRLGRGSGKDLGPSYSALFHDERHLYHDGETGRARAVADMNAALLRCRAVLPAVIGPLPPETIGVRVRALTAAEIATGRGGFRETKGANGVGAYVVDLKELRRRPRWTLPSVVAHETLPGHFLQMAFPTEPAPGFAEGWAIYAETLVTHPDPLDELGKLHWLLFRVCRGLVDIGIHQRGWTVDAARARLVAWQGEPAYFAPFDTDLPRIAREPGVRVEEAMTWLRIADGARGRTGTALRAYHRGVLMRGRA